MNWLKRKFWLWWFTKCPIGYSFMGHENGKLFWFYPFGVNVLYKKGQYISIHLNGFQWIKKFMVGWKIIIASLKRRPTKRAVDLKPDSDVRS